MTKRTTHPLDESGWAWHIPLHDGTTSVGVVKYQEYATLKKKDGRTPKQVYLLAVNLAPNVSKLLAEGRPITDLQSTSDYSYSCSSCADPSYRVIRGL